MTQFDSVRPAGPPAATLSPSYVRYALFILLVAHTLNFIDRQIINILAHPIQQELGLNDTQLGLLTGLAFALFYSVLGIPIARYADRRQSNRTVIIGVSLLVWSAMTALCGMAQNFLQLVLARVGVGVGEAGCTPPAHSLISDYVPAAKRASAIAFYGLGVPVGGLLGMVLGGVLAETYGWRAALFAVGLPGVVLAFVVFLTLREPRRLGALTKEDHAADVGRPQFADAARELMRSRSFCLIVSGAAIWALLAFGKTTWTTILFARLHGLSPAQVGLYFGVSVGVAGVIGTWLGGQLGDRFGAKNPRLLLLVPAAAITLSIPLLWAGYAASDWRVALAFIFLPSIASSMYYGPTFAMIQLLVRPQMRAFAVSILLLMANLFGAGLGPLAFGVLSDVLAPHVGNQSVRWVLIAGAVAGGAAAFIFWLASKSVERELVRA